MPRKNSVKKPKKVLSPKGSSPTRLALIALSIVIGIILFGKIIEWVTSLYQPITKDLLVKKTASWDGRSNINIAFKTDTISVISYNPQSQKMTILNLPNNLYMELPKGYGSWSLGSVYDLGQSENPPVGSELLKESLTKLLGLPMDAYITLDQNSKPVDKLLGEIKSNPISTISLVRQIKTDLTPLEAVRILKAFSSTRADKQEVLDFASSEITISKLLPDSSRVLGINTVALDTFIREKMADPNFTGEGMDIAVYNATSHFGLATELSRAITNMGGNVIFTSNTENYLKTSIVTSTDPQKETSKRITQLFAPQCLKSKCASTDPKITTSRAQINVIVGEDYFEAVHAR